MPARIRSVRPQLPQPTMAMRIFAPPASCACRPRPKPAHPTFKWRLDEHTDILGYSPSSALFGCSYTAFQIEVYNADTDEKVYDSGLVRTPAKDAQGFFTWTPPLYADDQTSLGKIFSATGNWKWRVVMNNAKFTPEYNDECGGGWSEYAYFSTDANAQQETSDHIYSSINVAVKYTGPKAVLADCEDLTETNGKVRIQAFATADFSGEPVAQGLITNKASLIDTSDITANGRLVGLPYGTYYIRAYIDSNGNFKKDDWESWGYVKDPVVVKPNQVAPLAGLYIEDADTDQDWLPDAWEVAKCGDLKKQAAAVDPEGRIVLKQELYDGILAGQANFSRFLSGASTTFFQNIGNAVLLLGLGDDVTLAGIADLRRAVEKNIEPDSVKITSFTVDTENGKVVLTVGAEATDSIAGELLSPVYITTTDVTIKVYRKDNLALAAWEPVKSVPVTIDASTVDERIEVPISEVDFNSGFYKVEIDQ